MRVNSQARKTFTVHRELGRMLGPLLGAALDNALRSGDAALTGPVARGDAGTVAPGWISCQRSAPSAGFRTRSCSG
ncbi:DUF2520 domain-containing protein [Streptomyces sp. NPDC059373]